jgi:hypothetical protein
VRAQGARYAGVMQANLNVVCERWTRGKPQHMVREAAHLRPNQIARLRAFRIMSASCWTAGPSIVATNFLLGEHRMHMASTRGTP